MSHGSTGRCALLAVAIVALFATGACDGLGRAGWGYIDGPALDAQGNAPDCNQDSLELNVYTSPVP